MTVIGGDETIKRRCVGVLARVCLKEMFFACFSNLSLTHGLSKHLIASFITEYYSLVLFREKGLCLFCQANKLSSTSPSLRLNRSVDAFFVQFVLLC